MDEKYTQRLGKESLESESSPESSLLIVTILK